MIGPPIGRYRILGNLERGDEGTACRAEDTLLRREVVLQVLPSAEASPEARARFLAEATSRYGPDRILDAGETEDGTFYVVLPSRSQPPLAPRRSWLWAAVVATLMIAAAAAAFVWKPWRSGEVVRSVAVLPFLVVGPDEPTSAPLASGLSEILVTKLTQISGLRVTPWMTSRRMAPADRPLEEIREALGVEALLTGTVGVYGDRVGGAVTLVRADGGSVWTEPFEARLDDLFAVQSAVAVQVAQRLKGRLSGNEMQALHHAPGRRADAYVAYLRGADAWQRGRPEEAESLLQEAIALDSYLAVAHTALGALRSEDVFIGRRGGLSRLRSAEEAYQRALDLDPSSIGPRRGLIHIAWMIGTSEQVLQQATAVRRTGRTDAEAVQALAEGLLLGGFEERSIEFFRRVLEMDPGNQAAAWWLPFADVFAGRYADAIRDGTRYLERFGEDTEPHVWMGFALAFLGNDRAACDHGGTVFAASRSGGSRLAGISARLLHACGDARADQALLQWLDAVEGGLAREPDHPQLVGEAAGIYALLGDREGMHAELGPDRRPAHPKQLGDLAASMALAGELDLAIELSKESIRRGYLLRWWETMTRASAPPEVRSSTRWIEVESLYDKEHARLAAMFPELAH